jgi:hypothetical protein
VGEHHYFLVNRYIRDEELKILADGQVERKDDQGVDIRTGKILVLN